MSANVDYSADIPIHNTNLADEMGAYDRLDPRIREFLRNLPMNFSAEEALEKQRMWGVEETLNSGKEMVEAVFPGWTPI